MNAQFDFSEFHKSLENIAVAISAAVAPMVEVFEQMAIALRQSGYWRVRLPNESIVEYIERVPDVLDNPDVRWEYQVHIWQTPIRLFQRMRNR